MGAKGTATFYDAAGKPTSISINIPDLTGASITGIGADMVALTTALAGISLSAQYHHTMSMQAASGTPADRGGLRGTKALIRWFSADEGDGGQYGSNEMGAVDPSLFTPVGDKLVLQGANYDAVKAAFDALAETENGNSVSVYEIELVSRNI